MSILLLLLMFSSGLLSKGVLSKQKKVIQIIDLQICEEPNLMQIKNKTLTTLVDGRTKVYLELYAVRYLERTTKVKFAVSKCKGGNCENIMRWNMRDICFLLTQKNTPWSPVLERMKPQFNCPLKKGLYVGENIILDPGQLIRLVKAIDVEGYTWRIKVDAKDGEETVMCFVGLIKVMSLTAGKGLQ